MSVVAVAAAAMAVAGCGAGGGDLPGGVSRSTSLPDHGGVTSSPNAAPGSTPQDRTPEAATGSAAAPAPDDEGTGAVRCGQDLPRAPADATGGLRVSARFPREVAAGEDSIVGTVEVTSEHPVTGVGAQGADVFLVRDGRVVTVPVPADMVGVRWVLGAEPYRLPGAASLTPCEGPARRLPSGDYRLYVRVVFTPDSGPGAGTAVESFGGPWPLQVR
jgi:hypothetical protein